MVVWSTTDSLLELTPDAPAPAMRDALHILQPGPTLLAIVAAGIAGVVVFFYTAPYRFLDDPLPLGNHWAHWIYDLTEAEDTALRDTVAILVPLHLLAFLWIAAVAVARRWWRSRGTVVVAVIAPMLFVAALAPAYPRSSHDVFHYIAEARTLWVYDENPMQVAPNAHRRDFMYRYVHVWERTPSPYGPGWALLTFFPLKLAPEEPLALFISFKMFSGLFLAGSTWVAYLIARRLQPARALSAAVLVGWSPLAFIQVGDAGSNDPLMLFFMLLSLYFAMDRRWWWCFPMLAVASSVKFVPLLVGPPLLIYAWRTEQSREGRLQVIGATLLALITSLALFFPFWEGWDTFEVVSRQGRFLLESLAAVLAAGLYRTAFSYGDAADWARRLCLVAFALAYAGAIWRQWRGRGTSASLLVTGVLVLYGYLLFGAVWFQPWYLLWLLVLLGATAPAIGAEPAIALTAGGLGVIFGRQGTWGWDADLEPLKDALFFLMWSAPTGFALWRAMRQPTAGRIADGGGGAGAARSVS